MAKNPTHGRSAKDELYASASLRTLVDSLLSEERYRAVVEQTADGIFLIDGATKSILEANSRFEELLGYGRGELHGMSLYELVPHDREGARANVDRVLRQKSYQVGERSYRRKDGSLVDMEISASLIEHDDKEILCCVARDITKRKRAEDKLKESERRFRSLLRNATDLITVLEEDGTISYESPTVERILGYLPEERVGKNTFDYLHPDDTMQSKATFAEALKNPGKVQPPVEFRLRHKDGSWRCMETTRTNLLDDPAVRGVVANSRDITERKEAEIALRESEERFRTAFEDAPIGVALVGLDRTHLRVNRAYCEMLGYSEEELLAKPHPEIIHSDDREESADRIRGILEQGAEPYALERRYLHADGHEVWSLSNISLIQDPQGKPSHFVCLHEDVTERKELEEHLEHQAFHDSLTDLPNRALFLNRLEHALAQTGREDGPVAVLLLDLNHFKMINDSLGHDAGNVALVGVAKRLRTSVRPGDTVGRIFGDEFAVLLGTPSGMNEARRVAGRIQKRFQEPLEVEGQEVLVSPSIGIALGYSAQDNPEEVLRRADLAMYTAKKRGKAEYEEYSPAMEALVANRVNLERDLRRAVEREEFETHYQPIVELHTGEIVGVEALARWRHPERGLVEAEEFIETAEETGLIRPIGQRVVEEACRQAEEWRQRYPQRVPMLSVNLSANQFVQQPNLIPKVLEETGLKPSALQVEITERVVMDDADFALAGLKELKDLGVSLAIDDFGMGYSCLYHLKHMPIDYLKIDRAFVVGLGDDQGDEAILTGTVGLAHALGVITVAEGVETADQQKILRELGCDLAQGYHFARPLPREAMEELLANGTSY